ncbi:hypothetical protein I4F81_001480 [Pyropia yezoensis]|uniref:Uncharacterized protein n=1 Tax=Pyropia yezoensis TaxID=2788 RepID=A0ACC3BLR5_PYRYE|nr:hypothetical protein I4F81_001480 [Neopyropia yezoensis]
MASTLTVPLQLVLLGADALFAMHARLRQEITGPDAVPVAKCDTIFEDMFQNVFESALAESMFRLQPPLPSSALRAWLRATLTHPSVRLDGPSHERLFRVVVAGLCSQLLRATPAGAAVVALPATKLSALSALLRDVRLREEASRIDKAVAVFYSSLPPGEAARLRFAALAAVADVPRPPVDALVRERLQMPSGHLAPPPQGAGRRSLGLVRVYDPAGVAARREDMGRVTALGGNWYAPHRVAARKTLRLPPPEWWTGGALDAVPASTSLSATPTRGGAAGRIARHASTASSASSRHSRASPMPF